MKLILPDIKNLHDIVVYESNGGYGEVRKAAQLAPEAIIEEVKKSGLRGRGGAGFPCGMKWSFLPKNAITKYLLINGDESEPGSFKDRQIFEQNPHLMIEGILIACYAMRMSAAYIYIRGEYATWIKMVERALADAYTKGYVGEKMRETFGGEYSVNIYVHKGAGAYICGEESALMNSLEGKRGYPRIKPPFPAQVGAWGAPTIINNVETIANVPVIMKMGSDAYSKIGAAKHPGTLLFGVSGHVNKPGIYELPSGTLLTDIIHTHAGGVIGNKKIKAVIPGGSSMPMLRGDMIEGIKMDAESIKMLDDWTETPRPMFHPMKGSMIGTGGIIVMDEDTDIISVLTRITKFYYHESCGQCTPCREGCGWMLKVLRRIQSGEGIASDLALLADVAGNIEGNTICALGDAAAWPVKYTILRFPEEFERRVKASRTYIPLNVVHSKQETLGV